MDLEEHLIHMKDRVSKGNLNLFRKYIPSSEY